MDTLLRDALLLIDERSYVFYIVGALGILVYALRAREAYRQRRYTPFSIEREEATAMLRDSLIILAIISAIMVTTFYIDRVLLISPSSSMEGAERPVTSASITPTSPAIGQLPTVSPTATVEQVIEQAPESSGATATPAPTETLPSEPSPTITPMTEPSPTVEATPIPTQPPDPTATTAPPGPAVPSANCSTPGVRITSPANGQAVSGNVTIMGTADIERFQFYKVEFGQGARPDSWAVIGDVVRNRVNNGTLTVWPANAFSSGIWTLRLTVVDETGNYPAPCDIHVVVP